MKYQTKLYLSFLGLSLVCSLLGLFIVYVNTRNSYIDEFRSQVKSISATIAALVNADELKKAIDPTNPDLALYNKIQASLSRTRKYNTREDIAVIDSYILKPSPTNPKQMVIILMRTTQKTTYISLRFPAASQNTWIQLTPLQNSLKITAAHG